MGHDIVMLYVVISADNISAGLASAACIAFFIKSNQIVINRSAVCNF
jgi:hypothetical protein